MGYAKDLQSHLAAYKRNRLGTKEMGTFRHKGVDRPTPHVLPVALKWLNILEPIRMEVREYIRQQPKIHLHRYFHHLNSSQAFALNLFFPFFEGANSSSSTLLKAMGLKGSISEWHPEHIPATEEGTNVDIAWKQPSGAWTFCEVKLSEQEFGKASDDKKHRDKLANIYGPALAPYCPAEFLEASWFFENYQILRNIWLAARFDDASVVFLYPEANIVLVKPLQAVIERLSPRIKERIHVVTVESVVQLLASDEATPPRLAWYVELLAEKYILRAHVS